MSLKIYTYTIIALALSLLFTGLAWADETGLVWSTFLGGSGGGEGKGIAVDDAGDVYVVGVVYDYEFPTTEEAFDRTYNGGDCDAFVVKLSSDGSVLLYGTYLGGDNTDYCWDIVVNGDGEAYVIGDTWSANFPTTSGAFDRTYNGGSPYGGDAFVVKLNATGSALVYGTYLGASNDENGVAIAVDDSNSAYVTGATYSQYFPTTSGAFDTTLNGAEVFVTKFNSTGTALVYSTFLGGSDEDDWGCAIALSEFGHAYVTGVTASNDFPTTPGAFDSTKNGPNDAFVAKLNPEGSDLVYSTYLGGGGNDETWDIALDSDGFTYVTGLTCSDDIPITPDAFDTTRDWWDCFVIKLNQTGSAVEYGTFLGGSNYDEGFAIAVDDFGNAYVNGETNSDNFPTTSGAFDTTYNGANDAFVVKINSLGTVMDYGTFLGGSGEDVRWCGGRIAADDSSCVYVTGGTESADFPVTPGAFDTVFISIEVYVAKFDLSRYPVPVVLASFQATGGQGVIALNWVTASEVNCHKWEVYRSDREDGEYAKIGELPGRGSSEAVHTYQWVDRRVSIGATYFYKLKQVDIDGSSSWSHVISATAGSVLPESYVLHQNYPNPFNATTEIRYQLPKDSRVTLKIFNTLGQEVRDLVDADQQAGGYSIKWDGRDGDGHEVASGLYFCRLRVGQFAKTIKMVLIK